MTKIRAFRENRALKGCTIWKTSKRMSVACVCRWTAFVLKAEGKIRHAGISFHDRAEVLEQIPTDYPEIEVVQIQFNYVDYDDPAVQSRKCCEVCVRHGKPVIVMELVKGGNLVNLPEQAKAELVTMHGCWCQTRPERIRPHTANRLRPRHR